MKTVIYATFVAAAMTAVPALAGQPENSGIDGGAKALGAPGFAKASVANGKDLGHAADIFGNRGKGNGSDPDSLGLADDHDPGTVGGGDDTSR